jgi:hypothetical protein
VMEPTDLWESDDPARARRLHTARFETVFGEREVRAAFMVEVGDATPKRPQCDRSAIPGILGTSDPW